MGQQLWTFMGLPVWLQCVVGLGVALVALLAIHIHRLQTHPLANLPGGKSAHWLLGDYAGLFNYYTGEYYNKQRAAHGRVSQFSLGFGQVPSVLIFDYAAIAYIQRDPYLFHKPADYRFLTHLTGGGLLVVEGDAHKRQRRTINPAFSPSAIKNLMPVFYEKSAELKERMAWLIEHDPNHEYPDVNKDGAPLAPKPENLVAGARKMDMARFYTDLAFDIIGVAGFDYEFQAMKSPDAAVGLFRKALGGLQNIDVLLVLQLIAPVFDAVPSQRSRNVQKSQDMFMTIGRKLLDRKKQDFIDLEKTETGKDLLSLIIEANMAKDLPESQRLSDEEIIYQIATFLLAGSETTSNAMTWVTYHLARNPEMQTRLRDELFTLDSEPSLDDLNTLPFLENVVRESLRVESVIPEKLRVTTADTMIPLSEPVVGQDGTLITSINAPKGTQVLIPICAIQHDTDTWGEDAREFIPDRFDRPNCPAQKVPGAWGNLLAFNGGAHNCIGYRFALAQMKATIFSLFRSFIFEELPSRPEIVRKDFMIMLPWVKGEEADGSQMPLLVRPYHAGGHALV